MSNSKIAKLTPDEISELTESYHSLSNQARYDSSFKSDYEAAILVLPQFLGNVKSQRDFDGLFDKIVRHLTEAHRKADREESHIVTRTLDELVSYFISLMQKRIDLLIEEGSWCLNPP